jgi:hypothetical protein
MYLPLVKELAHKAAAEAARITASRVAPDEDAAEIFIVVYDEIFEHIKKKLQSD